MTEFGTSLLEMVTGWMTEPDSEALSPLAASLGEELSNVADNAQSTVDEAATTMGDAVQAVGEQVQNGAPSSMNYENVGQEGLLACGGIEILIHSGSTQEPLHPCCRPRIYTRIWSKFRKKFDASM